jgi:REP element-mobilizing transposase RayT
VGIRVVLRALARRHGVRVYEFAVTSNHLHAVLRAKTRAHFQAFLRAFAGVAARLVTGARRGHPVGRFWDDLAYSRVLHWGREFRKVRDYVIQNAMEALDLVPYRRRTAKGRPRKATTRMLH